MKPDIVEMGRWGEEGKYNIYSVQMGWFGSSFEHTFIRTIDFGGHCVRILAEVRVWFDSRIETGSFESVNLLLNRNFSTPYD